MRRLGWLFILAPTCVILYSVYLVSPLLALALQNDADDAIQESELLPLNSSGTPEYRPELIPRILHQTYKNESIPERWQEAQKSCLDMHPDYEYKFWTDASAREFIAKEYSWFLPSFDSYPYPIQRVDAFRYFVLLHYGGVYLDLDFGCHRRLDPLLQFNAFAPRTIPTGISNDVIGARPNHPWLLKVTRSLAPANRNWLLPYITVMASTGPLFFSVMWDGWVREHAGHDFDGWPGRVRTLTSMHYQTGPLSFFIEYEGASWHGQDAQLLFWMLEHWPLVTAFGFMLAGMVGFVLWRIYLRMKSRAATAAAQRTQRAEEAGLPLEAGSLAARMEDWRPTLWQRIGNHIGRGLEQAGSKQVYTYELVEDHDA